MYKKESRTLHQSRGTVASDLILKRVYDHSKVADSPILLYYMQPYSACPAPEYKKSKKTELKRKARGAGCKSIAEGNQKQDRGEKNYKDSTNKTVSKHQGTEWETRSPRPYK